jgi:hypothetical protein
MARQHDCFRAATVGVGVGINIVLMVLWQGSAMAFMEQLLVLVLY